MQGKMKTTALGLLIALLGALFGPFARAEGAPSVDHALLGEAVRISGGAIYTWPEGSVRVFQVVGNSRIEQGDTLLASGNTVLWFDEAKARTSGIAALLVYAEAGVTLVRDGKTERYQQLLGDFASSAGLTVNGPIMTYETRQENPLFQRADAVRLTQKSGFTSTGALPAEVLSPPEEPRPEELEIFADSINSWVEGDARVVVATGNVIIRKYVRKTEREELSKRAKGDKNRGKDAPAKTPSPIPLAEEGESIELTAERVVLWMPLASGDKASKVQDLRAVYAEGDVTLYRDSDILRADQIFQNRVTERGLMTNAEVRTKDPGSSIPFVFRADEVRQLDARRFEAKNGTITTDTYGKPHFKFKGQKIRLIEGKRARVVSALNNTFQIGDVPVFYWPFLSKDMRDDSWMIKNVGAGGSSAFGAFVLTEWDLYDLGIYRNDWSEASLRIDTYSKRGVGIGPTFEYVGDSRFGFVQGYYIHDSGQYDRSDLQIEQPDRGRLLWRHRDYLAGNWRLDAELSYLSDRGFLNEYFRREFSQGKPQETVQYLRKLQDNAGLTLLFQEKINDFEPMNFRGDDEDLTKATEFTVDSYLQSPLYDTTLQKFPELGYHQIGEPLFNSMLTYSTNTRLDVVSLRYDRDMLDRLSTLRGAHLDDKVFTPANFVPLTDPDTTARLDTKHDFSIPRDLGPVRVEQMFSMRVQAESNSVKPGATPGAREDNGPSARFIAGPRITATSNLWRVYDVHNRLLDINRLKHIITPQFRLENAAVVTQGPDRFHNFDPYSTVARRTDEFGNSYLVPVAPLPSSFNDFSRMETMDHMQRLAFEVRQRLQTKRGRPGYEETVDLAELRLTYTAFPGNEGLNRQFKAVYGDYVRLDAFWQVTKNILVEMRDNEVNLTNGQLEVGNLGVNFAFPPDWNLYLGQRFVRNVREVASGEFPFDVYKRADKNVAVLALEYTVSPKYAVTFVQEFDFATDRNETSKVIVSRKIPGWVIDFVADVNPGDNDTSIGIRLEPLGLSQGSRRFW